MATFPQKLFLILFSSHSPNTPLYTTANTVEYFFVSVRHSLSQINRKTHILFWFDWNNWLF